MKRLILALLLLVPAGTGAWFFFGTRKSEPATHEGQIPPSLIATAEKRDIDSTVEVTGDVTPDFQLEVRSEVGGKVKRLHVEPGQVVQKGDLLVEIDDTDLQNERSSATTEIDGAQLTVEKNRRNFDRAKELFAAKLMSRETFDNLSLDYQIAQNSLAKSQRRLEIVDEKIRKTKIMAPAAGTILEVKVIEGQVVIAAASVNSGTLLMTVADLSRLMVTTHVNQVDISRLAENQLVRITTESFQGAEMGAGISFIAPVATVKNNVKGFRVEAIINEPDKRLRPGMTVNLTIPVGSAKDVVSVPVAAIFKSDSDNARIVYVKKGDQTERRTVTVGISNLEYTQIKDGLAEGEQVLLVDPDSLAKKT